jgi:hypothetical protein
MIKSPVVQLNVRVVDQEAAKPLSGSGKPVRCSRAALSARPGRAINGGPVLGKRAPSLGRAPPTPRQSGAATTWRLRQRIVPKKSKVSPVIAPRRQSVTRSVAAVPARLQCLLHASSDLMPGRGCKKAFFKRIDDLRAHAGLPPQNAKQPDGSRHPAAVE